MPVVDVPSTAPAVPVPSDPLDVLSSRTSTALRSAGLLTLEALTALTPSELRKRPGVGPKAVAEVRAALQAAGLAMRPEAPKPSPMADAAPLRGAWNAAWTAAYPTERYPWDIHADNRRLLGMAAVVGAPERAQRAFAAYFRAAKAGTAYPPGPPTIVGFGVRKARWVLASGDQDWTPDKARGSPRNGRRPSLYEELAGMDAPEKPERIIITPGEPHGF